MFQEIIARVQQRKISLESSALPQNQIVEKYRSNSPIDFKFTLFDLAIAIGTCRTVASTKSNKFPLARDFLEIFIKNNANELRVAINESEVIEQKQDISKYLGEALSLIIAEKLYNLDKSTIKRIDRKPNESKPDFKGFNNQNKVVWEAKGSTGVITNNVIEHAKEQKNKEPADISFVSLAQLNSEQITQVILEDPPTLPLRDRDLEREYSRVMHYVNVFNFIGQSGLSRRYFQLMKERLEHDIDFPEFNEKERLFRRLKYNSVKIIIKGKTFLGEIERIGEGIFLYSGFDEKLLSVNDFLGFKDYSDDLFYEQPGNTFRITRDGICYGYITKLDHLAALGNTKRIKVDKVPYFRDTFRVRDMDFMLHFQLVDFIKYLFEREKFEVQKEFIVNNKRYDLVVAKKGKKFVIETKKDVVIKTFNQMMGIRNALLITTAKVSDEDIQYAKTFDITIIDRQLLRSIIAKQKRISNLLGV